MNIITKAVGTLAAYLANREAQIKFSTTQIEAAAVDDFQQQLRGFTSTEEEREDVRRMALQLLQLGIRSDEVLGMAKVYQYANLWRVTSEDIRTLGLMFRDKPRRTQR